MSETDIGLIDLNYRGMAEQVCSAVVPTRTGFVLVDCGPSITMEALLEGVANYGLSLAELRAILLTHIHLDHAGAAGALAARVPEAQVFVHGRNGAPHLKEPEFLLLSAGRLYGGRLEALFGGMEPVPARQVVELAGGEALTVDGRRIDVLATPGHASHHLAYMDAETKVLFAGDAAGLREPGSEDPAPYTPPPDIDLVAWRESLERMRAARPVALLLTHFGGFGNPGEHLDVFERRLMEWAEIAKPIAESELTLEEAGREFVNRVSGAGHRVFEAISNPAHCGQGLVRYWRKLALPAGSR